MVCFFGVGFGFILLFIVIFIGEKGGKEEVFFVFLRRWGVYIGREEN